jgi:hypothetical protein
MHRGVRGVSHFLFGRPDGEDEDSPRRSWPTAMHDGSGSSTSSATDDDEQRGEDGGGDRTVVESSDDDDLVIEHEGADNADDLNMATGSNQTTAAVTTAGGLTSTAPTLTTATGARPRTTAQAGMSVSDLTHLKQQHKVLKCRLTKKSKEFKGLASLPLDFGRLRDMERQIENCHAELEQCHDQILMLTPEQDFEEESHDLDGYDRLYTDCIVTISRALRELAAQRGPDPALAEDVGREGRDERGERSRCCPFRITRVILEDGMHG